MGHSKKPLDARLRAAADMALETLRGIDQPHAADIGCDHGFVTAYLLRQRPELSMIAGDISEASLAKTSILLSQMGMEHKAITRCGDGLEVLSGQPPMDVILIAGMGGKTILEILDRGRENIGNATLVLQANTDIPLLREGLYRLGLGIIREAFPEAGGRRYVVIMAKKGTLLLDTPAGFKFGTAVRGIESMGQRLYLAGLLQQLQKTSEKLSCSGTARTKAKYEAALEEIEELNRLLKQ
ncbi:MAG: SAM-dependent methyltransferase [Clostridia bacterium]|nr:SAM-dependent methyltransferase [Clostridia bacterium]